jgi:LPXTG-motif cell wall-anchored protein
MRRSAGFATLCAFASMVLVAFPSAGPASAAPLPVVTVTSGPTTRTLVVRECDDVVSTVDAAEAFVVHRDVPDAAPLEVTYTTSGEAQSGSDFEPLSGSVTIPANADAATVPVTALLAERTKSVDLTITISGGGAYTLGDPATVTLVLVVRRDPELGPMDCNPSFQLGSEATNREQTIHVGETPVDLTTTAPTRIIRLVDGELPPGISIGAQGAFVGSATTPGNFDATLEACPLGIVFTCRQNTLLVHVLPVDQFSQVDGSPQLPVTGTRAPGMTIVGLSLLAIGAVMARSSRRRAFRGHL